MTKKIINDVLTPEQRHHCMSKIRGKDTKPELVIRKALFKKGFRYKLHDKNLPGKPDLVFPKYQAVIFIHGCFWHRHKCHLFKWPLTRATFWRMKINRNHELDLKNYKELKQEGWYVLTIWECAIRGKTKLSLEAVIDSTINWLRCDIKNMSIKGKEIDVSKSN